MKSSLENKYTSQQVWYLEKTKYHGGGFYEMFSEFHSEVYMIHLAVYY